MKYEKKLIIITTLLTLFPMLMGVLLWNRLPDQMPTHWNAAGEIDGYMAKPYAVFGLCGFLTAVHLLAVFVTGSDPKNPNVVKKVNQLVLWIVPAVGLFVSVLMYFTAMGYPINVNVFTSFFTGILFIIVGNYMPKCRPNYTIGIKLPWTLADDDNWVKTHRMAGPVWMAGGVLIILSGILGDKAVFVLIPATLIMVLIPSVYSYLLYRKKADGEQ